MGLVGAIFDLDGVIVNTVPIHFKAWKRMFEEYGKTFTFEDYKQKVDGIPRTDGARAILTDLSDKDLEKAATKKQDYFLGYLKSEKIELYSSTVSLIKNLRETGKKVAVISSSKNCKMILEKVGLISTLDAIVDGHQITKGKPNPQIFLTAAERIGAKPSECVVFEDAVLGVEAAKRAEMRCVGIDRYSQPERLKKADTVVSDLSEITVKGLEDMFDNK